MFGRNKSDKSRKEIEAVRKNYDLNAQKEWERLGGFSFEFEIAKRYLEKFMRGKTVLDIGGGPGRYSVYLAELGYDVTLVDLSEGNVELAKRKFEEYGVNAEAHVCDARDLSALDLGKFDNVLLMGPLYHLSAVSDREKCVTEAKKHLADDGVLFASFITITAGLNYYYDTAPENLIDEPALDLFDRMAKDETWSGRAFTQATFINSVEVLPFFERLGFEKLALVGQEGLTGPRLTAIESASEKVRQKYLEISLKVCENPQYYAYSNHLLYAGRVKR